MERRSRILIVEDEPFIAFVIEDILAGIDVDVAATLESNTQALDLIEHADFDAAIVDCSLADGDCEPVVAALVAKAIPFVIVSGHDKEELASRFADIPIVAKPFMAEAMEKAVRGLLAGTGPRMDAASRGTVVSARR